MSEVALVYFFCLANDRTSTECLNPFLSSPMQCTRVACMRAWVSPEASGDVQRRNTLYYLVASDGATTNTSKYMLCANLREPRHHDHCIFFASTNPTLSDLRGMVCFVGEGSHYIRICLGLHVTWRRKVNVWSGQRILKL